MALAKIKKRNGPFNKVLEPLIQKVLDASYYIASNNGMIMTSDIFYQKVRDFLLKEVE